MKKHDLFMAACLKQRYLWRSWICTIFAVSKLPEDHTPEPYDIDYRDDGVYFYDDQIKQWAKIEDAVINEPLFNYRFQVDFPEGFFPNAKGVVRTTYGRAIYNWMCLIWPFGDAVEFINAKVTSKTPVPTIISKLVDDDKYLENQGMIKASSLENHLSALSQTTVLSPLICPTGTERTIIASEEVRAYIKKALAEKGDNLTRQDLVAIQNHAIELDKKYLAEDGESLDFYISGTTLKVRRFKQLYMFGAVDAFHEDGKFDFIAESLDEGIPIAKLPAVFNDGRQGSYDRGLDTAKGGYGVNNYKQISQNLRVMQGDCGAKTHHVLLDDVTFDAYCTKSGFNKVVNGKVVPIDASDKGNIVAMRRPLLCKHGPTTFCSACAGSVISKTETQVASDIPQIQSDIMYGFMSAMHGNVQETAKFDFKKHMR